MRYRKDRPHFRIVNIRRLLYDPLKWELVDIRPHIFGTNTDDHIWRTKIFERSLKVPRTDSDALSTI